MQNACNMMGARTFLNQLAVDTIQHQTHGFTDEIDVSTLKDYMKVGLVFRTIHCVLCEPRRKQNDEHNYTVHRKKHVTTCS